MSQPNTLTLKQLLGQLTRMKSSIEVYIGQLRLLEQESKLNSGQSSGILKHDVKIIQSIVCLHYGIRIEQMLSKARPQHIADARAVALWLCDNKWKRKQGSLATIFNMTRPNVSYQLRRVNSDPLLLATAQHLKKVIK